MEHNLSKGNEFFLQVNSHANQIIFHMKGCARDRIKTEVKNSKCNRFNCRTDRG